MSEEVKEEVGKEDLLDRINPAMLISLAVGAVLVALFALISLVLLLSMSNDISHLDDQMRKLNKATKVMEHDLTQLRTSLVPATASTQADGKLKPASPKPSHMDASDSAKDCVVRSGSKNSIADCFK